MINPRSAGKPARGNEGGRGLPVRCWRVQGRVPVRSRDRAVPLISMACPQGLHRLSSARPCLPLQGGRTPEGKYAVHQPPSQSGRREVRLPDHGREFGPARMGNFEVVDGKTTAWHDRRTTLNADKRSVMIPWRPAAGDGSTGLPGQGIVRLAPDSWRPSQRRGHVHGRSRPQRCGPWGLRGSRAAVSVKEAAGAHPGRPGLPSAGGWPRSPSTNRMPP